MISFLPCRPVHGLAVDLQVSHDVFRKSRQARAPRTVGVVGGTGALDVVDPRLDSVAPALGPELQPGVPVAHHVRHELHLQDAQVAAAVGLADAHPEPPGPPQLPPTRDLHTVIVTAVPGAEDDAEVSLGAHLKIAFDRFIGKTPVGGKTHRVAPIQRPAAGGPRPARRPYLFDVRQELPAVREGDGCQHHVLVRKHTGLQDPACLSADQPHGQQVPAGGETVAEDMVRAARRVYFVAVHYGVADRRAVDPPPHPEVCAGAEGDLCLLVQFQLCKGIGLLALTPPHVLEEDSVVAADQFAQVQGVPIQVDVLCLERFVADFQRVGYRRVALHGRGRDLPGRQSFGGGVRLYFKRSEDTPAGWKRHRRGLGFRQARFATFRVH